MAFLWKYFILNACLAEILILRMFKISQLKVNITPILVLLILLSRTISWDRWWILAKCNLLYVWVIFPANIFQSNLYLTKTQPIKDEYCLAKFFKHIEINYVLQNLAVHSILGCTHQFTNLLYYLIYLQLNYKWAMKEYILLFFWRNNRYKYLRNNMNKYNIRWKWLLSSKFIISNGLFLMR